jgi:hypothetical protein
MRAARPDYNPLVTDAASPISHPGRCLCGAVRFVARGAPRWVAHCHCESCRRATSSPFTTYAGYLRGQVVWSGTPAVVYRSSPGVERSFCACCGSPMSFAGERWPGEIHLFLPSFEDPAALSPEMHVHAAEQLPWVHLHDHLPRYLRTAREGPPLG